MKLAFVNFYQGYASRGGETYVDCLAEELSKNNEVVVYQAGPTTKEHSYKQISSNTKYDPKHNHANLPVTHFLNRLFLDYFHLKELLFTLKIVPLIFKFKPHYIFPQNSGWEVLILSVISKITKSKIVIAGQSGPGWNDRVNLFFKPYTFVALTNSQASWAKKAGWPKQKIVVIPNGVDHHVFSKTGEKFSLNVEKPIILAVGAASPSKRITATIKAVSKLEKGSLVVAGTGPQEKFEDNLGLKLLGLKRYKRIKITHDKIPSLYRSADVFTLCSERSEAFGIAYLEALATNIPVVATDDASRREIVGNAGIFVKNPEESDEYSQAIKKCLAKNWSKEPLKQSEKFSWKNIAKQYQNILVNG